MKMTLEQLKALKVGDSIHVVSCGWDNSQRGQTHTVEKVGRQYLHISGRGVEKLNIEAMANVNSLGGVWPSKESYQLAKDKQDYIFKTVRRAVDSKMTYDQAVKINAILDGEK